MNNSSPSQSEPARPAPGRKPWQKAQILNLLSGQQATAEEIAGEIGASVSIVKCQVQRLRRQGYIEKATAGTAHGSVYKLTTFGADWIAGVPATTLRSLLKRTGKNPPRAKPPSAVMVERPQVSSTVEITLTGGREESLEALAAQVVDGHLFAYADKQCERIVGGWAPGVWVKFAIRAVVPKPTAALIIEPPRPSPSKPTLVPPAQPHQHQLMSPHEVAARVAMSWRTVQRLVRTREFPEPVRLSANRIAFLEGEVSAWINSRERL